MLILARASQDDVVSALGPVDADVGPTSATGLTAVWCTGDEPIRALTGAVDLVAVWDEPDEGHVVLHLSRDGVDRDAVWPLHLSADPQPPSTRARDDLSTDLCAFFGVDARPGLAPAMADVRRAEHLTDLLEEHFEVPVLDPVRTRAVTVHRGHPSDSRIAARLTAGGGSGVEITPVGERWTVLDAGDPGVQQVVTLATAAAGSRRAVVLQLWRGDGAAAGFELVHRDHVIAQGSWDDGWRRSADEDWPARDAVAEVLARRVGGEVDLPALRALLRARTRTGDPLARLVEVLGIPAATLDVLDGTSTAPAEVAEPAGPWRVLWDESRRGADSGLPIGPRWVQLTVAALAGLVSLVLLVLGVGVVATDGALLDHAGVTASDWLILPVAGVGVAASALAAHRLVRRGQIL
ncbi:hypothetical protein ACNHYB_08585 [Isoptericola jiangsuensis]|uniref:hypothetical protein n=1 Tax=Isoptericola jiangsuensis TaxID=548579 RepID=UPI003AB058AD